MKKTLFVSISIVLLSAVCFSAKHGAEKTKAASVSAEEAQRVMELPNSIASLYGVEGVYVLVENLHADAKALGLKKETVVTMVKLKLRLAGVRILSEQEYLSTPDGPCLYININASRAFMDSASTLCAVCVSVEFCQTVDLTRWPPLPVFGAPTWRTWGVRAASPETVGELYTATEKSIDTFIDAYLMANPKK